MPGRNCSLVKSLQAAECGLASFLHIGYRMLAAADSTFHSLSLSLKIKKTDDCIRALTGKAYTWPVGTLLHSFTHKDSEIAAPVDCFFVVFYFHSRKSETSTHKQICSPSCDVSPRHLFIHLSMCSQTLDTLLLRTRSPAAHYH